VPSLLNCKLQTSLQRIGFYSCRQKGNYSSLQLQSPTLNLDSITTSSNFGSVMSTFEYEPVDSEKREIRILHILPLDHDSTGAPVTDPKQLRSTSSTISAEGRVSCTLTKVSLNDKPKYLALSYTWGAKIFKKIEISSVDRQRKDTVEVTANLEEALRYLRQESNPVCIWIDALCINQGPDAPEKTEQVGLMQHIYGQCTSAVVWLGPAAESSDEAMEALDRIGKKAEHAGMLTLRKEHYANWPRPDPEGRRNAEQKALDDLPVQDAIEFPHQAFGTLSLRSY
jgi:hypothetical protein